MPFESRVKGKTTTIALSGDVTAASASELHAALVEALSVPGRVVVEVSGLERADASLVQLLASAFESHRAEVDRLSVAGDLTVLSRAAGCAPELPGLLGRQE